MLHADIYLFALLVVALLAISYGLLRYVKIMKDYFNQPEDKNGLYDFVNINDYLINVDHITNIVKRVSLRAKDNCKFSIWIYLKDNEADPIIIYFSEERDCEDVFGQILMALDAAVIAADDVQ